MQRPTMTYFKSLVFNFLGVFFVNHVVPGIMMAEYTKLPHVKGEFIFSFGLGFLLSLVFPVLKWFKLNPTYFKIGLITLLISAIGYAIVNILPLGIKVQTIGAYVWCTVIVWFLGYMTNFFEFRQYLHCQHEKQLHEEKDKEIK